MALRSLHFIGLFALILSSNTARGQNRGVQTPFRAIVGPVLVAHRGGSLEVPENTMAALRHAIAVGADWIEIDVTLSRDDKVVVIHDATLDRTTSQTGPVGDRRLQELIRVPAGAPKPSASTLRKLTKMGITPPDFGERFQNETVPSLRQILEVGDIRVMIEMKAGVHPRRLAHGVVDLVNKFSAWDRVAVASFDHHLLTLAHDRDPVIALIAIAKTRESLEQHLVLPVSAVAVSEKLLPVARKLVPFGVGIWVWTIRDADTALLLRNAGVDGIITDIPQAIVKHLRPEVDVRLKLSR